MLSQKPDTYSSDESKIQYIIGLLHGRVLDWATALWEGSPAFFLKTTLSSFLSLVKFWKILSMVVSFFPCDRASIVSDYA